MTTLERIEELKKITPTANPEMDLRQWGEAIAEEGDFEFLLQAFETMREIAIDCLESEFRRPTLIAKSDINFEFESRMQEKTPSDKVSGDKKVFDKDETF